MKEELLKQVTNEEYLRLETPKHIVSPTGCVHIANFMSVNGESQQEYTTLCGHVDPNKRIGDNYWHNWPVTEKEATCKRCISASPKVEHRLKSLTIRASDLETDFWQLAKKCEFYYLEDMENAQIFHDLPWKLCSHRRRLGTKKNPRKCNLLDCPLKYEK